MKKLIEKIRKSKLIGTVTDVVADVVPFGGTAKRVITGLSKAVWTDENQDGKIQLNEIDFKKLATILGSLVVISALLRFDVVTKDGLLFVADLILSLLGG